MNVHEGRKPLATAGGYLAPRVTFPPLAYCWSCGLDTLTFCTAGMSLVIRWPSERRNMGTEARPYVTPLHNTSLSIKPLGP